MKMQGLLPEGNYAECANGYRIHYLDEGQGEVVVFLHGSGPGASGYSNFKGNYRHLVDAGYRCIIPDLIGYGFSDKPTDVDHYVSAVSVPFSFGGGTDGPDGALIVTSSRLDHFRSPTQIEVLTAGTLTNMLTMLHAAGAS